MFCAVDCETTGLIPGKNDLITLAILPLTPKFEPDDSVPPFTVLCKPRRPENIQEQALRINGCTREMLATAMDTQAAIQAMVQWFKDQVYSKGNKYVYPLAHNWAFDKAFLLDWLDPERKFDDPLAPFFHYQARDSQSIAHYYMDRARLMDGQVPYKTAALRTVARAFGMEFSDTHDALGDCRLCAAVYRKFALLGVE